MDEQVKQYLSGGITSPEYAANHCPSCAADLDGGPIPEVIREHSPG